MSELVWQCIFPQKTDTTMAKCLSEFRVVLLHVQ